MEQMPVVKEFTDGSKCYALDLEESKVFVYTAGVTELTQVVNFGFRAPFFLVFAEEVKGEEDAKKYADEKGFSEIALRSGTGVTFVCPKSDSFATAKAGIYEEIIANSKIAQYYKDSVTLGRNRFTGEWERNYIRGGVQRTYLYGKGAAADYIAKNLLQTVEGQGLYGPGDITPAVVVLDSVSEVPVIERKDIPVISVGNTDAVNKKIQETCQYSLIEKGFDCVGQFDKFGKLYHRMVGNLIVEPDFDEIGFVMEPCVVTLKTSPDNMGDDKDTTEHKVGYVAYYNQRIIEEKKPVPLVMCFHGGGDSAMCMASVSGWYMVAHKHNFLLVAVENHLESTATEMQELIAMLKEKYPVDASKIYSTGFSMGGCKSWDMMQEYPKTFAAIAPMSATFEVGYNSSGKPAQSMNETEMLPVFYVGGAITPLPELPFQAQKCLDRMNYVMRLNHTVKKNPYAFDKQEEWEDKIYGIHGDDTISVENKDRAGSVLTMELFKSENGKCYTSFGSVSDQSHEVRMHSCEHAFCFMNGFYRDQDGNVVGGDYESVVKSINW